MLARSSAAAGRLELQDGAKIAVIGGGPAGSFFSYFLISLALRLDQNIRVDIFEPRDFLAPGPRGCNMCAGIISESLVQNLAAEGINLPPIVAQRGIDSYVLYTSEGKTRIKTGVDEKRIASVFRGAGPRNMTEAKWKSFDAYILELAIAKGAQHKQDKIANINWNNHRPELTTAGGQRQVYDLTVFATGVNPVINRMVDRLGLNYKPPETVKSHIREFCLGPDNVSEYLGDNVHIFLLPIPRLEYAAIVPKSDYATMCLIGEGIDGDLIKSFLSTPQVRECLPPGIDPKGSCRCSPSINMKAAVEPFSDRIVFIGDCGATRLFKDGIGAAYKTAKAAATTALLQGISAQDFHRHFWPIYRLIENDNKIGRIIFTVNSHVKKRRVALAAVVRMVDREQRRPDIPQRMSGVLWDTFTGSAMYRDIFKRAIHPFFQLRYLKAIGSEIRPFKGEATKGA